MFPRDLFQAVTFRIGWLLKWGWRGVVVGVLVGLAVAGFLWSLDRVTAIFWRHPGLFWMLPGLGYLGAWLYERMGGVAAGGTNLVIDQIHEPDAGVPWRMAPLVLLGTLLTHLGGGSAGREGTAVQMGGGIAGGLARWWNLGSSDHSRHDHSQLLMCGVAAGFGAVFGTPLAGTIFALEVLTQGQIRHQAMIPCLTAAWVGDRMVLLMGLTHAHYQIVDGTGTEPLEAWLVAKVIVAAVVFGWMSLLFLRLTHGVEHVLERHVPTARLRPVIAAVGLWGLTLLLGSRDYLGLGVNPHPSQPAGVTLQSCFHPGGATPFSWLWKTLSTALTVGGGFKGGEVTPLFFIGAALGHSLAEILNLPIGLLAALGFVAVFAGASKTPLACTLMALELFVLGQEQPPAPSFILLAALACHIAWGVSGPESLYRRQRTLDRDRGFA